MSGTATLTRAHQDQLRHMEHRLVREHDELPPEVVRHEIARVHDSFANARVTVFVPILVERAARRRLSDPLIGLDIPQRELVRCGGSYSPGMSLCRWGWHTARRLLAVECPRRWAHSRGVAHRAAKVARALPQDDRQVLVAAAWLHDIGYADALSDTGFHQIDGARYLRGHGAPERVCGLVAYHSGAAAVAEIRGLSAELGEFTDEHGPVRDALWYCDMTTGPDGAPISFTERMRELRTRRRPDDPVIQALAVNERERAAAVHRTERLLRQTPTAA